MPKRLLALVGTTVEGRRFDEGERIDPSLLTDKQRKYLLAEGFAQEVEEGQRLPADVKRDIIKGAGTPNPVEEKIDTREEE
jgi:hypothetical protein